METFLTIDWDYFLPSARSYWPLGAETLFSMTTRWKSYNLSNVKTENVEGFWKHIKRWFKFKHILVSESHIVMYDLLMKQNIKTVVSFDCHHDCYYNTVLDCGSWGTNWLEKNTGSKMYWVSQYPKSGGIYGADMIKKEVREQVKILDHNDIYNLFDELFLSGNMKTKLDFIHICRSGCWSPPQFDKEFKKFLEDSKCKIEHLPDFLKVNPLDDRMSCLTEVVT